MALVACEEPAGGTGAATNAPRPVASRPHAPTATPTESREAASPYEGRWQGRYRATRAEVTLPPGVKEASWSRDDGSGSTGEGTVELRIDAAGQVSGTSEGALGALGIRGMLEEETVRAVVTPLEPTAPGGMSGYLIGQWRGAVLSLELRTASFDAGVVRRASLLLERR